MQGSVALALCTAGQGQHEETVPVEVASGLIGGYVTQLMRTHGVRRIIATAGGTAKRDLALKAGADVVLDHTDPDWPDRVAEAAGGTVDVAFTSIGGATTARYLDAMTPGSGRILVYGLLAGPPGVMPMDLLTRGPTLTGCGGAGWMERVWSSSSSPERRGPSLRRQRWEGPLCQAVSRRPGPPASRSRARRSGCAHYG
jgi:NADPH2:quinone reductase